MVSSGEKGVSTVVPGKRRAHSVASSFTLGFSLCYKITFRFVCSSWVGIFYINKSQFGDRHELIFPFVLVYLYGRLLIIAMNRPIRNNIDVCCGYHMIIRLPFKQVISVIEDRILDASDLSCPAIRHQSVSTAHL